MALFGSSLGKRLYPPVTAVLCPTVEVTAKGPIHPHTGMVVNIADMKVWIEKAVMNVMDHRNIDRDVPHFR